MVAAAIGIAAAASVAGGVLSSKASSKASDAQAQASDSAAQAQLQGTREGIAATKEMYNQSRADTAPWRSVGQTALQEVADLYGMGSITVPGSSTPVATSAYQTPLASNGTGPSASGLGGSPSHEDWIGYLQKYPDLQAEWQRKVASGAAAQYGGDPAGYAQDHWNTYGQLEGRTLPGSPSGSSSPAGAPGNTARDQNGLAGNEDFAAYVKANPNLVSGWKTEMQNGDAAKYNWDPAEYGKYHYLTYGRTEGASVPTLATGPEIDPQSAADRQKAALGRFQTSPDYTFRLDEGLKALQRTSAARGNTNSGEQEKAITQYGQGLASTEYGTYVNRLASLAGIGATTAQGDASGSLATGSSIANLSQAGGNATAQGYLNSGQARASGYLNSANAWGGALGNLTGAAGLYAGLRP